MDDDVIVFPVTEVPGAPKSTIPPSVEPVTYTVLDEVKAKIRVFLTVFVDTREFVQAKEMPYITVSDDPTIESDDTQTYVCPLAIPRLTTWPNIVVRDRGIRARFCVIAGLNHMHAAP